MFRRVKPNTRRALAGGLVLTAVSAGAASAESIRHGVIIAIVMLATVLVAAAIVQYGSRTLPRGSGN